MDFALPDIAAAAEGLKPLLDWRGVPVDLASLAALAAGLGWASGLRLYALVFVLGALARFGGVQLPGGLGVLAHPLVLGLSGLLLLVEFFADKLPWLDSAWDAVHTFIRIPAGAALAAAVMGDQGGALQVAMGLMGGTLAAGTHLAKAGARAAINTSPEPVSNVATSLGEDMFFAGGMWALVHQPLLFLAGLAVFFIVALLLIWALWKFIKRVFRRPPRPLAGA
ncbi:MAG: DUF4126 domain-containing protein [Zoogloea sp.]|uniref:DUF4126 domain-containing protein n=1 Tax=Zoogloea sp. TaxID=49181 RepID=UPI002610AB29|nr:DUF4126 domain-containing protein [Zoogloea sp.]MDD3326900.1 DUF4126 domain-containing protein [Zoogloea sp.]